MLQNFHKSRCLCNGTFLKNCFRNFTKIDVTPVRRVSGKYSQSSPARKARGLFVVNEEAIENHGEKTDCREMNGPAVKY